MPTQAAVTEPCLRIVEPPQTKFRFRYKSELGVTHGCLLAKTSSKKSRIHPTVELMNHDKRALIRCRLVQHRSSDEHPHRLQDGEQDISYTVPERGSYRVSFRSMTIVQTAKKDIPAFLYNMYSTRNNENPDPDNHNKELWRDCSKNAKGINLNIVRLRFSAHDTDTGREICEPVFSEPIYNRKSVATNALRICRMNILGGRPSGGDEVFMFVEKVKKDDIEVHFIEHASGPEMWVAKANFSKSDVHHQYAIVCSTPPYKDQDITTDVKVSVALFRPSDESYSEAIQFCYYAVPLAEQLKRKSASPCLPSTSTEFPFSEGSRGSTDGYSSAMDTEESWHPQTNEADNMTSGAQTPSYCDLDNIKADYLCRALPSEDINMYNLWMGPLQSDSGSGTNICQSDLQHAAKSSDVDSPETSSKETTSSKRTPRTFIDISRFWLSCVCVLALLCRYMYVYNLIVTGDVVQ